MQALSWGQETEEADALGMQGLLAHAVATCIFVLGLGTGSCASGSSGALSWPMRPGSLGVDFPRWEGLTKPGFRGPGDDPRTTCNQSCSDYWPMKW